MSSPEKIAILLADEDALRRDGLAAVLQGNSNYEVVAQCPDGEAALDQIRRLRPEVAVVDLHLPKLHGIELVRRVRSEGLGTKVVILSGSSDDDIIREVVRAGVDAYLLKNGPARHLIDAISYVRDGGQYFSPQLRRDGLDRRILEEPPRPRERAAEQFANPEESGDDEIGERPASPRSRRDPRYGRSKRPVDAQRLRERLRAESDAENLEDHDYEILGMMAEGIKPILDRLEEIEGRIGDMESGEAPVPGNVRGWLDRQMADTFGDTRSGKDLAVGRTLNDLEARLPQMIEEAVTSRFENMANKLQQEVEETHLRTLETFVKNIQVKLVQRVSALETDMAKQNEAMHQLREYSQRTEDNLSRLITGVDKLAQELPKRLAAPAEPIVQPVVEPPKPMRRKSSSGFSPKIFWMVVGAVALIAAGIVYGPGLISPKKAPTTAAAPAAPAEPKVTVPPATADTKTKMLAAQQYADNKEYALAENIYKDVLKAEPDNVDAMKALASVLYREDKIEESAAILEKLPHTN